jgi:2-Cys peroxiredoxin 5
MSSLAEFEPSLRKHDYVQASAGFRIPDVALAELVNGEVSVVRTNALFGGQRVAVIGVPGAFTPVCTRQHLPGFIANAKALRASGFSALICIAPNDPWTVQRWAQDLDPHGAIRFLSDGNRDFVRRLGLMARETQLFLGECSKRYVMTVDRGAIERIQVETSVLALVCTRAEVLLD